MHSSLAWLALTSLVLRQAAALEDQVEYQVYSGPNCTGDGTVLQNASTSAWISVSAPDSTTTVQSMGMTVYPSESWMTQLSCTIVFGSDSSGNYVDQPRFQFKDPTLGCWPVPSQGLYAQAGCDTVDGTGPPVPASSTSAGASPTSSAAGPSSSAAVPQQSGASGQQGGSTSSSSGSNGTCTKLGKDYTCLYGGESSYTS